MAASCYGEGFVCGLPKATDRDARGRGSLSERLQGQQEVIKKKVPGNGTRGLCPLGLNPVQTARPQQGGGGAKERKEQHVGWERQGVSAGPHVG